MQSLGLAVRVGVHAGKVATQEGKAGGITVHVAARLMAAAGADEVLLSATVRELAAGAGWTFADRGPLELKGLAEPVHAYALDLAAPAPTLATARVGRGAALADRAGSRSAIAAVMSRSAMLSPTPSSAPSPSSAVIAAFPVGFDGPLPLAPGQYTADALPGSPSLTVADDGWSVSDSSHINLTLARTTSPDDQLAIWWPASLATDPCAANPPVAIGPEPENQFLA